MIEIKTFGVQNTCVLCLTMTFGSILAGIHRTELKRGLMPMTSLFLGAIFYKAKATG